MRIQELFDDETRLDLNQIRVLRNSCDQYISMNESPLLKNVLGKEEAFARIKVRFHRRTSDFISVFNDVLAQKYNIPNLHQRSVFANGTTSFVPLEEATPYYVFPINGFKFMYSPSIQSSDNEYRSIFETLLEKCDGDEPQAASFLKDLMSYNYVSEDLEQGVVDGCEIILYNIPYYYAVNAVNFPDYQELLDLLER